MLELILLACLIDGLIALIGGFSLFISEKTLEKLLMALVGFSAGSLLAGCFYHLLSESLESLSSFLAFSLLILGFCLFFLMEKFIYWHHCHKTACPVHPYTYLMLLGDGIHNFIDGLIIAAGFWIGPAFGWITTLLIISHEIPQELGDFGVLVYGGMKIKKALFYNFLSQLTCVLGGLLGWMLSGIPGFVIFLLPIAAGGFLYISTSDLIPELHREKSLRKSVLTFLVFLLGIGFILLAKSFSG
ncbi:MAG: ZIP family metal transporter [Candidatus Aenigmatarchaeota archaeon]|nr:MAG: ZIP family metal transporter [Candidatus Aenigmarchaeota archaeon]